MDLNVVIDLDRFKEKQGSGNVMQQMAASSKTSPVTKPVPLLVIATL